MKTIILKLSTLVLLFGFITAGCKKDDFFELQIGDKNAVITHEVNGIEFKFCLLNELGQPATIFNEGENFYFQFSIKNNNNEAIGFQYDFINSDFFKIKSKTNDYGKSWQSIFCQYIAQIPSDYIIKSNETKSLWLPWIITNDNSKNIFPFCPTTEKLALKTGNYYTELNLMFNYTIKQSEHSLTGKKFKINFKVK